VFILLDIYRFLNYNGEPEKMKITYTQQKGSFVKHCPCTPDVIPCGYHNINLHTGCPFKCSYCILQAYLENPEPVYFTNFDDLERELVELARTGSYIRLGTGELSDSLAWDKETGYAVKLLALVEKFPKMIFEFKTKSIQIDSILSYPKKLKNVVMAWSLNPQEIIEREELLTPGLNERLESMAKAVASGYKIAIHFDPLILFNGWQEAYKHLVEEIAQTVTIADIAWWSMGALRFPYTLREHIFKHKNSRLFEGELVKGHDGKYRYFKPLRLELFQYLKDQIFSIISPNVPLYLCMEDKEVWQEILPHLPADEASVNKYLYQKAYS
jgi:spore photoproduct lyase